MASQLNLLLIKAMANYANHHKPIKCLGIELVIEYYPGELRNGYRLSNHYGHIPHLKSDDGMAADFWLGSNLSSQSVFKVDQLVKPGYNSNPVHDQWKYVFGADSPEEVKRIFLNHRPASMLGSIQRVDQNELTLIKSKQTNPMS